MELVLLLANISIIVFVLSGVLAGMASTPTVRVAKALSIPLLCIAYGGLTYWAEHKSLGLSTVVLLGPAIVTLAVVISSYLKAYRLAERKEVNSFN